jgi:septal ring factor EnvC (AmiA/AmiB activator)
MKTINYHAQTVKLLDKLGEKRNKKKELEDDIKESIDWALSDQVKEKIKEIEDNINILNKNIQELEEKIRADVLDAKETIVGKFLQGVFNNGVRKWNTEMLEKLAVKFPKILKAKIQGDDFVSIKQVK